MTKISLVLFPIPHIFSWELIERIIGFYTVYQLFIYATLTQIDDSKKDSYNTLKFHYEKTLIYFNLTNQNTKFKLRENIIKSIDLQRSNHVMNSSEIIEEYDKLHKAIINNDKTTVEIKILEYKHNLYHLDLKFTKSLFLRKFKDPSLSIKKIILIIFCILLLILYITLY